MGEPTLAALRTHLAWQLDAQLPRAAAKRVVTAVLASLDDAGYLDAASLVEVGVEELERLLDVAPTSRDAALLAGLTFMAAEDRDAAEGAFQRFLGEDLDHASRAPVAEAVTRLDQLLQHVGLLRRELVEASREIPAARGFASQLEGDTSSLRAAAQSAVRVGIGVRSASRVLAFLDRPVPSFEASASIVSDLLAAAGEAWAAGRFRDAKDALDRALGRDVLHDERDVVLRLLGAMTSRVLAPAAWAREARRELVLVAIAASANVTTAEVRHVVALVHRCDPIGVGARDPAEAMRLRAAWDGADPFVVDLADRALQDFEGAVDYPELSARYGLTVDKLKRARSEFAALGGTPLERLVVGVDPFASDLVLEREGPETRVTAGVRGAVTAEPTEELAAVGRAILARSGEFMRYGLPKLEPLPVGDVARSTGLTVDQVHRVCEGVLVATPWGTLAANHFLRRSKV